MRSIMIVWRDSHQPVRAPSMFSDRFTTVSCPPCEPHHSPAFILPPAHANTVHRDPAAPSHDPPIAAFNRLYSRCASRPPRLPPSAPSGLRGFSVRCRNGSVGLEFCRCLPFLPFALPPAKGCYPTLFSGTSLPTLIRNPVTGQAILSPDREPRRRPPRTSPRGSHLSLRCPARPLQLA